jgi:bile acid-coenzyme A ligase
MTTSSARQVSFGRRVSDIARARPDQVAVIAAEVDGAETSLTWRELDERSTALARLLAGHGVNAQTMVVICLGNGFEHLLVTLGAWKLGACVLPLSPRLPPHERGQLLALLGENRLVVSRDLVPPIDGALDLSSEPLPARTHTDGLDALEVPTPQPGKAIGSGGSTGRPKIIVDPRAWSADPDSLWPIDELGVRSGQVQLIAGPLYHNSPFSAAHYGLFYEHTLVVMERFDAEHALKLIEAHSVNFAFFTPTMMLRMSRSPAMAERDLSSLEAVYHTAMTCPGWLKREWIDRLGPTRVYEAYGATENIGFTTIRGDEWLQHPGSVGEPRQCDVRILDESGTELPPGEVGEVFLRDHGYPAPTYCYIGSDVLERTPDGFSSVGDLGWLDEDGYLFIADRRVDLVVTGGVNVYPAEVEAVLIRHPAVHDVVVVGLPDPDWGRRVHAIVQCADPTSPVLQEELVELTRGHLHPAKTPKSFEFVAHLPRDESGKVRRSALAAARAGQGSHDPR